VGAAEGDSGPDVPVGIGDAGTNSWELVRLVVSILYGLFVAGSLLTRSWHNNALEKLRTGSTLARLKVDAWVKASWMYGVPSWFFWGATVAVIVFVAMGLRMTIAAGTVETHREGARKRKAEGTPRERHIVGVYVDMLKIPSASILRPESTLPASKDEMKAALIAEGVRASRGDIPNRVNTVRSSYYHLADFVPDDVIERNGGGDLSLQAQDVEASITEGNRLEAEFDAKMADG
jgi:hypothetical protein